MLRELITTVLDLAGLLFLVGAVIVLLWPVSVAGALAAGGLGLLGVRWLVDRLSAPQAAPDDGGGV